MIQFTNSRYLRPTATIIIALFMANSCTPSKVESNEVSVGMKIQIQSAVYGIEREIYIHLPDGYEDSDVNYPLLVATDAPIHFEQLAVVSDFMQRSDYSPGMIIVGLDRTSRIKDYTPVSISDSVDSPYGGADKYLDYIEGEVLPYITENYRTSDYSIFAGWSVGGLLAYYMMAERTSLFDAYIALNPSLWFDEKRQLYKTIAFLEDNRGSFTAPIFTSMANETGRMLEAIQELVAFLENANLPDLRWKYNYYPGETHYSSTMLGLHDGLQHIFAPAKESISQSQIAQHLRNRDIGAIDAAFESITNLYGCSKMELSEGRLNGLGYFFNAFEEHESAIYAFEQNVNRHPESANTYDSLGDGYFGAGLYEEALASYSKAVEVGESVDDPQMSAFRTNVEKAQLALEK